MITERTHTAASPLAALCGVRIPPNAGARPIMAGSRVGVITGRTFTTAYVIGERDSNDQCFECLAAAPAASQGKLNPDTAATAAQP